MTIKFTPLKLFTLKVNIITFVGVEFHAELLFQTAFIVASVTNFEAVTTYNLMTQMQSHIFFIFKEF